MTQISVPTKTTAMLLLEARIGRPIEDVIREVYDGGGFQRDVADRLTKLSGESIDSSTVARWMQQLGIPARRRGRGSAADVKADA